MKNQFELLAPGGDIESIKAAIIAGADAVYCGLDNFNARNRAENLSFEHLNGLVRLAHQHDCKIFLTLNIIILESEIPAVIRLLNKLVNTKIDGVILQDLGLFYIVKHYFPTLDVHASTQANTHNEGQIRFLKQFNASRVNLSRELNIMEIKHLAAVGKTHDMAMEVFVHGSYCIGFSGLCYASSVRNGNSGNRGRCSQPCRDEYQTTQAGKSFPLNMKDNSAFSNLPELAEAGVYSLKVEGRIKKSHYVYTVVDNWRKQIDSYLENQQLLSDDTQLYQVFNRDFSNAYLKGSITKDMFIDNPRDNAVQHFAKQNNLESESEIKAIKRELYDVKTDIIIEVSDKIKDLDTARWPLTIVVSGKLNQPLLVTVTTPTKQFEVPSSSFLKSASEYPLTREKVEERLSKLSTVDYEIKHFDCQFDSDLVIPFKELNQIRDRISFLLNDEQHPIAAIDTPKLPKSVAVNNAQTSQLSVLVSSKKDLKLLENSEANFYYQLPDSMASQCDKLIYLFQQNPQLIPWFPAVLIAENYDAAVKFLTTVNPAVIVTNNTGIAQQAFELNIDWIAGPHLNLTNSFSLLCLKETLGCTGAFISNELNKKQVKQIVKPDDFELHYSIYHPTFLMTSRQCFFHQTIGCKTEVFDETCLQTCKKSTSIINLRDDSFIIDKQKGDHNSIYSQHNYLNTQILSDLPTKFASVFIDLRDIETHTQKPADKQAILQLFQNLVSHQEQASFQLQQAISPTINNQYSKGL